MSCLGDSALAGLPGFLSAFFLWCPPAGVLGRHRWPVGWVKFMNRCCGVHGRRRRSWPVALLRSRPRGAPRPHFSAPVSSWCRPWGAARPRPQSDRPTSTPPPMHTTTPIHELYPTRESAVPAKYPRGGGTTKRRLTKLPGSSAGAESPKQTHCACPTPPPFSS